MIGKNLTGFSNDWKKNSTVWKNFSTLWKIFSTHWKNPFTHRNPEEPAAADRGDAESGGRWWLWGVWVAAWGVWIWAGFRVMSYATGQDSLTYFSWAKRFIADGFSAESIAACGTHFVPGFPLLLAALLKSGVGFGVYWVNVVLMGGVLGVAAWGMRRVGGAGPAALGVAGMTGACLAGYALNAHFVLLPFRGAVQWLFLFGGVVAALPAFDPGRTRRRRWGWALLAGTLLLVGTGFRETAGFAFVPLSVMGLWGAAKRRRGAWAVLGGLWAPVVMCGVVAGAVWMCSGGAEAGMPRLMNGQVRLWLSTAGKGVLILGWLPRILQTLGDELTWVGVIGLVVGICAAARRGGRMAGALVGSAGMMVLLYSWYRSLHMRYVLEVLGPLALVSGWGIGMGVSAAARRWRWSAGVRRAVYATVAAGMLAWGGFAVTDMGSWGPRVSRAELRALAASPAMQGAEVWVDRDCRFLVEAIAIWTKANPRDPRADGVEAVGEGAYFVRALDERAWYRPARTGSAEELLRERWQLKSVGSLTLGGCAFEVLRAAPKEAAETDGAARLQGAGGV